MKNEFEHLPKTAKEAKEKGEKFYFTGKPCNKGHNDKRLTSNGTCFTCSKARSHQAEKDKRESDPKWQAKKKEDQRVKQLREEAIQKGQTWFEPGIKCVRGHITKRNVYSSNCHECWNEDAKKKRDSNPKAFKEHKRKEYECNKDQILAHQKEYREQNWEAILERRRNSNTHKEYMRQYLNEYLKQPEQRAKQLARTRKRQAMLIQATPLWFEEDLVLEKYIERDRISRETGIEHHVDHKVPLNGETVCGLHCIANLRIIPATENIAKSNKLLKEYEDQ